MPNVDTILASCYFFSCVNSVLQTCLLLLALDQILFIRGNSTAGSAVGSTSGRNIMTHFGLHSQVSTLSNSSRHNSSRYRRICCGGFLPSPPRRGRMSLFKYCKGFLLKKVIKKHSDIHLLSKVALHYTSALHIPSVSGNTFLK